MKPLPLWSVQALLKILEDARSLAVGLIQHSALTARSLHVAFSVAYPAAKLALFAAVSLEIKTGCCNATVWLYEPL
jgi:hypothetical protein